MTRFTLGLLATLLLLLQPGPAVESLPREAAPPVLPAPAPVTPPAEGKEASAKPAPAATGARKARPRSRAADAARVLRRINPELSEEEALRIGDAVVKHGTRYGLDLELVLAVILVESGARPTVVSPAGALGLMQVMPAHFERLGLPGDGTHVERNVQAGCSILARNIARHGEARGILAYYWGEVIRGEAYLEKVRAAQAQVRARLSS